MYVQKVLPVVNTRFGHLYAECRVKVTTPEHWAAVYKKMRLERGDQSVPADLLRVANAYGPFDLIVEDGGQ